MSYPSDDFSLHWSHEWAVIRLLAVDPSARGGSVEPLPRYASNDRSRSAFRLSDFT